MPVTLKNALLSWYTFVHAQSFASTVSGLGTWAEMVGMPRDTVSDADEKSPRQNHMLGCLRGFNLAMFFLCAKAWTKSLDQDYFRDQLLIAEGAMYAITAYDAYQCGVTKFLPAYIAPALLSGFAILADHWNPFAERK